MMHFTITVIYPHNQYPSNNRCQPPHHNLKPFSQSASHLTLIKTQINIITSLLSPEKLPSFIRSFHLPIGPVNLPQAQFKYGALCLACFIFAFQSLLFSEVNMNFIASAAKKMGNSFQFGAMRDIAKYRPGN